MLCAMASSSLPDDPIGVVLAGGASRRMGQDKALLRLPGAATLLETAVAALREAGLDVAVSFSTREQHRAVEAALGGPPSPRIVIDERPGRGPLGGLHAALRAFPGRYVLLVACDMPRLDAAVLQAMARAPRDADILMPRSGGHLQPLHALYGPACLPVADDMLAQGQLALKGLLDAPGLRVRYLDDAWLLRAGANRPAAVFDNVNTPAELAALVAGVPPLTRP